MDYIEENGKLYMVKGGGNTDRWTKLAQTLQGWERDTQLPHP